MNTPTVRFVYLRDAASLYGENGLAYATSGSIGLDLRACFPAQDSGLQEDVVVPAGARLSVPTGIAVEPLDPGVAGFVYARSGLGAKMGLTVAQGVGVIDPDYRGEITVILLNTSGEPRTLRRGERVAQLVFQPAFQVTLDLAEKLGNTARGAGGFGHTGR